MTRARAARQPRPPPTPAASTNSCQYDELAINRCASYWLATSALNIQRATEETTHAGLCVIACPNASISLGNDPGHQGPL